MLLRLGLGLSHRSGGSGSTNTAPHDIELTWEGGDDTFTLAESVSASTIGALTATDDQGNPLTFTITADESGVLVISGSNIVTDDDMVVGEYDFTVRATDTGALYVEQEFTITVTDALTNLDGMAPNGAFSLSRQMLTGYGGAFYTETSGAITSIRDQDETITGVDDQGSAGNRPALSTAGPNSVACADFNGTSHVLQSNGASVISNQILVNSKFIVVSAIFDVISTAVTASFATVGHALVCDATGRIGLFGCVDTVDKIFAANYVTGATDQHVGIAITEGTTYVLALRHDGTTLWVSVNGGAESSIASGNTEGAWGALRFGQGGASAFFNGKLFEAAFWKTIPSADDRAKIIAYFMDHVGA